MPILLLLLLFPVALDTRVEKEKLIDRPIVLDARVEIEKSIE